MHSLSFIPFPLLSTPHFLLRQLNDSDANAIYILRTDEGINQFLGRKKATSIEDAHAFIQMINDNINNGRSILWGICTKEDPALLGTICLWNINTEQSSAEIGYELLPQHHGKGIMQEVIPSIINYGFSEMNLRSITAELSMHNVKSIRLLEKFGFVKKEVLPAETYWVYEKLRVFSAQDPKM